MRTYFPRLFVIRREIPVVSSKTSGTFVHDLTERAFNALETYLEEIDIHKRVHVIAVGESGERREVTEKARRFFGQKDTFHFVQVSEFSSRVPLKRQIDLLRKCYPFLVECRSHLDLSLTGKR